MATRWARVARGWTTASCALFVAALSHTLGGGAGPGALGIVLSLAFAVVLCIGLSGRTASLWRVSVSVLASQLIFRGRSRVHPSPGRKRGSVLPGRAAPRADDRSGLHVQGPGRLVVPHAAPWAADGRVRRLTTRSGH